MNPNAAPHAARQGKHSRTETVIAMETEDMAIALHAKCSQ